MVGFLFVEMLDNKFFFKHYQYSSVSGVMLEILRDVFFCLFLQPSRFIAFIVTFYGSHLDASASFPPWESLQDFVVDWKQDACSSFCFSKNKSKNQESAAEAEVGAQNDVTFHNLTTNWWTKKPLFFCFFYFQWTSLLTLLHDLTHGYVCMSSDLKQSSCI